MAGLLTDFERLCSNGKSGDARIWCRAQARPFLPSSQVKSWMATSCIGISLRKYGFWHRGLPVTIRFFRNHSPNHAKWQLQLKGLAKRFLQRATQPHTQWGCKGRKQLRHPQQLRFFHFLSGSLFIFGKRHKNYCFASLSLIQFGKFSIYPIKFWVANLLQKPENLGWGLLIKHTKHLQIIVKTTVSTPIPASIQTSG